MKIEVEKQELMLIIIALLNKDFQHDMFDQKNRAKVLLDKMIDYYFEKGDVC
jgi:hypothetical protein